MTEHTGQYRTFGWPRNMWTSSCYAVVGVDDLGSHGYIAGRLLREGGVQPRLWAVGRGASFMVLEAHVVVDESVFLRAQKKAAAFMNLYKHLFYVSPAESSM